MLKHRSLNTLVIIIITGIMLYILLKDSYLDIFNALVSANYLFIILAIITYILYMFFDILTFKNITDIYTNKVSLKDQMFIGIVFKFFSGITPLSTGGQPFQIYELHKKGVPISTGTNIALQSYLVFQIAAMSIGLLAIISNSIFNLFKYAPGVFEMAIVGFVINFAILFILITISFSKNFNKHVITSIINILSNVKIVKNREEQIKKWENNCNKYYETSRDFLRHPKVFIKSVLFEIISLIFYYSIPFILTYALNIGGSINLIQSIAASSYVYIMGCYVPIPGATGGMEVGFQGFFGNFFSGYILSTLLIIWRTITYYLPTIIGAIFFNFIHTSDEKKMLSK